MTGISIVIARRFGADGYGDFVKITTYVGFFYLFADFGLNAIFITETVGLQNASAIRYWRSLLGLRLVLSTVLIMVAGTVLSLFPLGISQGYTPTVRFGIYLLIPAVIAQATITTANAFFQKILRYDYASYAQHIGSCISVCMVLIGLLVFAWQGAIVGTGAVLAGTVATSLAAIFFVRMHGPVAPQFSLEKMRQMMQRAFPLGLTLVANLIYFHSDSVIIALTRPTHEVGVYGLAFKAFELPLVFPLFFINSVFPFLVQAYRTDRSGMIRALKQSLLFLFGTGVFAGIVLWILAPCIIYIKPEFISSTAVLRVLAFGLPVFFVSSLSMWVLITTKQYWILCSIHGTAMVLNIMFNSLYIPTYGYMAAAYITIGIEAYVLLASWIAIMHNTDFPVQEDA